MERRDRDSFSFEAKRAENFRKIFEDRKQTVKKAELSVELLRHVDDALLSCSNLLRTIVDKFNVVPDGNERKVTAERLQREIEGNFSKIILAARQDMGVLLTRLKRPTLNIGITGNAGIGKSTLLQRLTGLPNDIIPARDSSNPMGGSCTGAPSIIVNNTVDNNSYAKIEFYQESDFFNEIIKPYYVELDRDQKWLFCPANFYEFMNKSLPDLPSELGEDNLKRNLYDALKYRHENAKQYQQYFGQTIPRTDDKGMIRKYVAQKDANNNPTFDWIPVKLVTIFCPFEGKNGERITTPFSVCDTPGLGDIGCRAEESLMHNIAENIDAVWMLNLVTSNSQIIKQADSDLYMLIRKAVPEWTPQQWVYGVVNRFDGTTAEQVKTFRNEMQSRHFELRKVFELDARNREHVLQTFDETLDDIVNNQHSLDESLYQARFQKIQQCLDAIRAFAEKELQPFLKEYESGMMDVNTARERFRDEIWDVLRNSLTDLKDEYDDQSTKENELLKQCVQDLADKKDAPDFLVKPVKQIAVEIKSAPSRWMNDEMTRLRVALGKEIGGKTVRNLAILFDELREKVQNIFLKDAQLEAFLPETENPSEWWNTLAEHMREVSTPKKDTVEDIARGIEAFQKATLSYEQLLEPRITQYGCLDVLNPDKEEGKEKTNCFDPRKAKEENKEADSDEERFCGANYARETLQGQIQEALEKVCKRLNESFDVDGIPRCILVEPSAALYSTIEKFYLVLFADEVSKQRWEDFYADFRDEIWSNDPQTIPQSLVRQWNDCIVKLRSMLEQKQK